MTTPPVPPLTVDDVDARLKVEGFEAATANLRKWVAMETVNGPDVVAELRYWLHYLGGD